MARLTTKLGLLPFVALAISCAPTKFSGPQQIEGDLGCTTGTCNNPDDPGDPGVPGDPTDPTDPNPPEEPIQRRVVVKAPPKIVDVLMVIDDSKSMVVERKNLADRFSTFTNVLGGGDLDWQICLTKTSPAVKGQLLQFKNGAYMINKSTPAFQTVFEETLTTLAPDNGSHDEQGIAASVEAIRRKDPRCFRQDAALAIIVVSDEDERSAGGYDDPVKHSTWEPLGPNNLPLTAVQAVADSYNNDQKIFSFHSLVIKESDKACYDVQNSQWPAFYGRRYSELSRLTGGVIGSICSADYGSELSQFANSIRSQMNSVTLECAPVGTVKLNVNPMPSGFGYAVTGNKIQFNQALDPNTEVTVDYYCAL